MELKRVLYVSRAAPNSNGRGVERRAAQHLETLKKLGPVTLVLPASAAHAAQAAGLDLNDLGLAEVIVRHEPTRAETTQQDYAAARGLVRRLLTALARRYDVDQTAAGDDAARYRLRLAGRFDLLFAFRIDSAVWADSVFGFGNDRPPVCFVDFDDIESIAMARNTADLKANALWRFLVKRYVGNLATIERRLCRRWPGVSVCSEHDADVLAQRHGVRAEVVPNAVDFSLASDERAGDETNLLFVGTFSYRPNAAGLSWFVAQVWPRVREKLGAEATLSIVGFDPPQEILDLGATPGVEVLGPVVDLNQPYRRATLVIVPIHSGGGTRIKLIEAMSRRRAVVTTALGCEGLGLLDRVHAAIADTPEVFAARIVELALNPAERSAMAARAWDFGRARLASDVVGEAFEDVLRRRLRAG